MNYLINEKIIVNNEGFKLKGQSEIEIKLTVLPARILEEILALNGGFITRDILFKRVWENVGLEPSNSSLTQYISILRKSFRSIGIEEDVILTIPKVGFKLNENIRILSLSPLETTEGDQFSLASESLVINENKNELVTPKNSIKISKSLKKEQVTVTLMGFFFICVTILALYFVWAKLTTSDESDLNYLDNVFGCNIYTTMHEEEKTQLENAEIFIEKNRTPCLPHNMFIISTKKKNDVPSGIDQNTSENYSLCNLVEDQGMSCEKLAPIQQS